MILRKNDSKNGVNYDFVAYFSGKKFMIIFVLCASILNEGAL
jgi:hypothetical protein